MKKTVPLIVGNWKMSPLTLAEAINLVSSVVKGNKNISGPVLSIAPPFLYLSEVGKKLTKSPIALASQDVHFEVIGAATGETSILQLKNLSVEYVIVGHSERRALGETDEVIRKKVEVVLKYQLTPIICIGERERDDQGNFFTFVENQLRSLAEVLPATAIKKVIIAYEPIWAIGTGNTATPDDVKEMQIFIESVLTKLYDRPTAKKVKLLYGGSVKPQNAKELHSVGDMDGFLVGGASLKADDFLAIIKAVNI